MNLFNYSYQEIYNLHAAKHSDDYTITIMLKISALLTFLVAPFASYQILKYVKKSYFLVYLLNFISYQVIYLLQYHNCVKDFCLIYE